MPTTSDDLNALAQDAPAEDSFLYTVTDGTGLTDTATGQAVLLTLNGDVVEGRTETSDDLVFTVTVNGSGVVELSLEFVANASAASQVTGSLVQTIDTSLFSTCRKIL